MDSLVCCGLTSLFTNTGNAGIFPLSIACLFISFLKNLFGCPKSWLPDVQAGFRKGRGTRDQIANIRWIIKKAREFQKNIYFCFIDYAKAFDCVDHNKPWKILKDGNTRSLDLPLEKPICRSGSNSQNWTWNNRLVPNRKRSTSRLYIVTLLI